MGLFDIDVGYWRVGAAVWPAIETADVKEHRNGIDVNWKLHIDIPSVSSRLASSGNRRVPRELLQCRGLFTRLFVLIALSASNLQCPYASAVEAALSGKAEQITITAPVYAWIAPTAHSQNSLGTLTVTGENHGSSVPLLNPSIHSKAGVLVCERRAVGRFWQAVEDHLCGGPSIGACDGSTGGQCRCL